MADSTDPPSTNKPPLTHSSNTGNRRPLGEVSPNLQSAAVTPAFMKTALVGSPLKRSFTAAIAGGGEGGGGLRYFKRRRVEEGEENMREESGFRPVFREEGEGGDVRSLDPSRNVYVYSKDEGADVCSRWHHPPSQ